MATEPQDSEAPPTPPQGIPPQPAQSQGNDVAGQWRSWMTDPENRASLMQFGISMLQPIGLGQTAAGHFGQAVGEAGEAATRVRTEAQAKEKLTSQADLREAQANLAEQRALGAGQNLGLQQEMLELKRMLGGSQRAAEMMKNYEAAKLLNPDLKLEDYMKQHQQAIKLIQQQEGGGSAGTGTTPGAKGAPIGTIRNMGGQQYRKTERGWEVM